MGRSRTLIPLRDPTLHFIPELCIVVLDCLVVSKTIYNIHILLTLHLYTVCYMYNIQWGINTFLEYVHINLVSAPLMYVKFMHTSYGTYMLL